MFKFTLWLILAVVHTSQGYPYGNLAELVVGIEHRWLEVGNLFGAPTRIRDQNLVRSCGVREMVCMCIPI